MTFLSPLRIMLIFFYKQHLDLCSVCDKFLHRYGLNQAQTLRGTVADHSNDNSNMEYYFLGAKCKSWNIKYVCTRKHQETRFKDMPVDIESAGFVPSTGVLGKAIRTDVLEVIQIRCNWPDIFHYDLTFPCPSGSCPALALRPVTSASGPSAIGGQMSLDCALLKLLLKSRYRLLFWRHALSGSPSSIDWAIIS